MHRPGGDRPIDGQTAGDLRLDAILDSIADGYCIVDADWRIRSFNSAAEQFFGRGRDEMLGRLLWDAIPTAAGTSFETNFRRAAAGEAVHFEAESTAFPGRPGPTPHAQARPQAP